METLTKSHLLRIVCVGDLNFLFNVKFASQTQDVNWTYIRPSEDAQDVFWTSYLRSIYVLCLQGESYGGNPVFEKCSVGKIIELKETYTLKDIWIIRNPKSKQYTFWQKHISGFFQRRLDYFFISSNIQEFILDTDLIPAISSDH